MHFCGQIVNFVTSFAIVNLDTLNLKTKKEKLKPCNRNRKRTKKNCIFYGTSQFQDFWSPITFFLHNVVSSNFLRRYEYTERKIFYNFLNTFSLDHNLNFFLDHPVGFFFNSGTYDLAIFQSFFGIFEIGWRFFHSIHWRIF